MCVQADPKELLRLHDIIMKAAFDNKVKEDYTVRDLLSVISTIFSTLVSGFAFSEIPKDEREGFIITHIMTTLDVTREMLEDAEFRSSKE